MSLVAKITDQGRALMAAANNGETVRLSHFAIDDGAGASYAPTGTETALKNEVHRAELTSVYQKADDPTTLVIEAHMDANTGPFWMRAVGIFAENGTLVALVETPEIEVVPVSQGFASSTLIQVLIPFAGNANITLTIDASQVMATKGYVENFVENQIAGIDLPEVPTGSNTTEGGLKLANVAQTTAGTLGVGDGFAVPPASAAAVYQRGVQELGASTDLNDVLDTGVYVQRHPGGLIEPGTNYPYKDAGTLLVMRKGNIITQMFSRYAHQERPSETYIRGGHLAPDFLAEERVWEPWAQLYTTANLTSATTIIEGLVRLATSGDMTANDTTRAVTPSLLNSFLAAAMTDNGAIGSELKTLETAIAAKSTVAITIGSGSTVIYPAGFTPEQCFVLYTRAWGENYRWNDNSSGTASLNIYSHSMLATARGDTAPVPVDVLTNQSGRLYQNQWLVIGVK